MHWKNSAGVDGGRAEGQACADPGARTPIGAIGIFQIAMVQKITILMIKSVIESGFAIFRWVTFKKFVGPPILADLI